MIRLLKAEFFKIRKNRTFKILLLISMFISIFTIISLKLLESEEFQQELSVAVEQTNEMLNIENNNEYRPGSNAGISMNYEDISNPTAKEIFDLYSEKDLINKKLAELQKDPLFEDGHWWTSSQGAKKDTAFYLNLDTNRFSDGKKTISRKCCLIKKLKADYNSTQP